MLFNQDYESCYEELINWYPRYYREVREMTAILKAHGQLADDMQANIEQVLNDAFVTTADETTIAALETILNIPYSQVSSKTLEERKAVVISYFSGFGKLSATGLKEMLAAYTDGDIDIKFEPADEEGNNLLSISINRGTAEKFYAEEIMNMLARRLPAHIWHKVDVVYTEEANIYYGFACVIQREIEIAASSETADSIEYLADENGDAFMDELYNVLEND